MAEDEYTRGKAGEESGSGGRDSKERTAGGEGFASWADEEFGRRAEDARKAAADLSHELRRLAADVQSQFQMFTDDVRRRARKEEGFSASPIEKIRALAELRDEGIISEEEFQEQKTRLLDQI